jgi:hypothetical protein
MTIDPPENSTPNGIPCVLITARPARMTTQESARAYHRQRRKSNVGVLKIFMIGS